MNSAADRQKNKFVKHRLQSRLLLRIGLLALATGLLFSSIQIYLDYRNEEARLTAQVEQILSISRKAAAHTAWNLDSEGGRELLLGLLEHKIISEAELRDDLGRVIATVKSNIKPDFNGPGRALFGGYEQVQEILYTGGSNHNIDSSSRKIGVLQLTIDPALAAHDFVVRSGQILLGDLLRVILLVCLLLSIFSLTLTRPLLQTGERLRKINPEAPGVSQIAVPQGHAHDELGSLTQDLNALLASVQQNIRQREEAEQELKNLNHNLEQMVNDRTRELATALDDLRQVHHQLKVSQSTILQQDKMASIGQLAAGVAHEINNPMGFITSNLGTLDRYRQKIFDYLHQLESLLNQHGDEAALAQIQEVRKKLRINLLREDIRDLLEESKDGAERVTEIVQNLKGFSRVDQAEETETDINDCLEKTLNIAWNEIKYKAKVEKSYADLPLLSCHPQQLNQVFLNLVINAAHAIEEEGVIRISTRLDNERILVAISDSGSGIVEENLSRLFEPFFTTKEVGKGIGLGLSIAYDIVQKHGGDLLVDSEVGQGTTFTVSLPLKNAEQS